ncbi:MAG: methylornithine synthase PylB [Eubacteriales bacterium]|nr:methylornithine synthase PylB [Eubacteriales bacterium]
MKAIKKALNGDTLNKKDIISLLSVSNSFELDELFSAANTIRNNYFGNRIFLYGFIYFSTFCKNNCNFCYYRRANSIERYRKNPDEVVLLAQSLAEAGVNLIDLTMGEDPQYHEENFARVIDITKRIKQETGLPVMISPGVVSNDIISRFKALDVEWYALYQETHNRALYDQLRIHQDYDRRMDAKVFAQKSGMLLEEGILVGVGETIEDIADSILEMKQLGASQVRAMGFVPQKGSPMADLPLPDKLLELKVIAALRLTHPKALIPASLDIEGIKGLGVRLDAGANVVTSIIPPNTGLVGVAQNTMDVDAGGRTVGEIKAILSRKGLQPATVEEYRNVLENLMDHQAKRVRL